MISKNVQKSHNPKRDNSYFTYEKINFQDNNILQEEKISLKIDVIMPKKEDSFDIVEKNVNVE